MFGAVVPLSEPPGIVGVASRQSEPMDTPRIKTPALATVYLDEEAVGLMGDPRPKVSKIVAAGGKRPESVQVLRGLSATDLRGKPLRLDDTIDRTVEPARPIYLTSKPLPGMASGATPSNLFVPVDADRPVRPLGTAFPSEDEAVPKSPVPLPRDPGADTAPPAKPKRRPLSESDWPS